MHVVECPGCSSLLKVPKPVSGARLKCRKCGVVFVGASREMPDPSPGHPAAVHPPAPAPRQAPATSPYFRVTPKRTNNNVVYITIGAAAALILLVVAVVWHVQHQPAPAPPKIAQAPAPTPPPPKPPPGVRGGEFFPPPPPVVGPTPATAPKPVTPPAPTPPPAPVLPANLPVDCRVVKLGLTGMEQAYIQGSVRNDRPEGVKSVTVEIRVPDGDKPPVVRKIICSMLAPQGRSPFMLLCPVPQKDGFKPEDVDVKAQVIAVVPLEPKQICWNIEGALVRGDEAAGTRTITGSVKNLRDVRVTNIEIFADVYFGDGRLAGTATGKLEHGDMLDPSARDDFSLPFDAAIGTRLQTPVVRAAGFVP
ncbi:MAG: hypothetical protein NTV86_09305 [Planctomycetota bacterium]|nr:hypothetical protein [Planctomycetota bacterium]